MIKFILSAFKPVCTHEYVRVNTIHGDMINALDGKRSLWKCSRCGKFVFSRELNKVTSK